MQDRIKKIRQDAGMTQQDFADKIHMSRNHVARVETGERQFSASTIAVICSEFGVNESWLVDGAGEPYIKVTTVQEVAEIAAEAAQGEPSEKRDELIKFATDTLVGMTDGEIAYLYTLAKRRGYLK